MPSVPELLIAEHAAHEAQPDCVVMNIARNETGMNQRQRKRHRHDLNAANRAPPRNLMQPGVYLHWTEARRLRKQAQAQAQVPS